MRSLVESYSFHKKNATKLQEYLRENFTHETIAEKFDAVINSVAPDDMIEIGNWLEEINKNLQIHE